jgi:hypothetical protein
MVDETVAMRASVLWQPHAAFAAVLKRHMLLITAVVVLASAAIPAAAFVATQNVELHIRREMKLNGALEKIPASLREQTIATSVAISTVGMPVGAVVVRAITVFVTALLCIMIVSSSGVALATPVVLSTVALAHAPLVVRDILQAVVLGFSQDVSMAQTPLVSSPAALLNEAQARTMWGVALAAVDVFSLWAILLVAIGMHRIGGGPRGKFLAAAALAYLGTQLPSILGAGLG